MTRPIAAAMGLLIAGLTVGQNILNNGSFETGMMCYSVGEWSQSGAPYTAGYQFLLSSDSYSGNYSLEINCTGTDCLKAAAISDVIQSQPGQSYTLSVETKCPSGRMALLYVPGTAGGDTSQFLTCNGNWAPNRVTFSAGPAQTNFFFYLFNYDVSWVRFDDVVLTYAGGTVPQQQVLHPGTRNVSVAGQTVQVDGAPYFAMGFFDVEYDDLPLAVAAGANTVDGLGVNMSARCFNDWRESYLDRAYDLGLNFVPNSSSTAELGMPAVFPAAASTFAPHLANIMWFLADEPDQELVSWEYILPQTFVAEYQAAKPFLSVPVMADFQHAAWDVPAATQPYTGSVDVWMVEPYGTDFSTLSTAVNTFSLLSPRPIWLAEDDIGASLIVPKAYWAAISGATGIIYFNWDTFKSDPAALAAATQAFGELHQLEPAIFATNIDSQVTPPAGIGVMARSLNGSDYILAANPAGNPVQSRFLVAGLQAGTQIPVLFENRTVTADAGGFTDSFPGISRHVYVVPGLPSAVTITTAPPGLTLSVDDQTCISPCDFQWIAGTNHTIAVNQATQAGAAGTQYVFSGWSDGGAVSHAVTAPASGGVYTAVFATQYELTIAVSPAAGGTATPASGSFFGSGAIVAVTATANNGYSFENWIGKVAGANSSATTIAMSSPQTVTADFASTTGAAAIQSVTTADGGPGIAQNTFIVIKGVNLVPATTPPEGVTWDSAPSFSSGQMPTQVDGVSVTVDGKPAYIYFFCSAATSATCTSDQLNVLTPLDDATGPVPIIVTSGGTSIPAFTASMQAVAPAFLLFGATQYVAATHANNTWVGPTALYQGSSTPARAGEEIVVYAVGFGLPSTALVIGSAVQSGELPVYPVCTVGGNAAGVAFAGLSGPGLYQLNLTIPPGTANGDNPITCSYGGATTPAGDLITVAP